MIKQSDTRKTPVHVIVNNKFGVSNFGDNEKYEIIFRTTGQYVRSCQLAYYAVFDNISGYYELLCAQRSG